MTITAEPLGTLADHAHERCLSGLQRERAASRVAGVRTFALTRSGALIGGVLGGLVSSTATTVSYTRRTRETTAGAKEAPAQAALAAVVILAAQGRLEAQTAWRLILGSSALRTRIVILFGLALAGGAGILLLWN